MICWFISMNGKIHVGGECFNMEKDWTGVFLTIRGEPSWKNSSDNIAQLAIQGPKAISVLQKVDGY